MDRISIRYGEGVTLPIDVSDLTAVSASIYIGKPGQAYTLTKTTALEEGVGIFALEPADTRIPLGTYNYQINVTGADGLVEKYPSPDPECSSCNEFPEFVVSEALDEQEVS